MLGIKKSSVKKFTFLYAIFISVFHFYINLKGGLSDLWFNAAHFSFLASLGFLTYSATKKESEFVSIIDILLSILVLVPFFYLVGFEESLYQEANGNMRFWDLNVAVMSVVLAIEITRRTTGVIIPTIMLISMGYILYFGKLLSGVFAFGGMTFERFFYRMYFTSEGLFGSIATISSTYVFMFILFAAFLLKSGAGDFIVDLSSAITSRFKGGAGHVAVFSSALMGTISGSAVANTVSTGSITIPMMKKNGFKPIFAAGVETAASTGGQIMPPIMGAGAFIMAQMTHIPFVTIILVSILPAILYFSSIAFYIHIHAKKYNIDAQKDIDVKILPILREGFHFIIPLSTLIGLLIYGFTPTYAAGISIVAIILSSYLTKTKRMGFKEILEALALGSQNMVVTGVLLVSVGIIVGAINISGIGITFSQLIMEWSGGQLIIAFVLIAIASLILGMGLPVTASYVVLAVLSAPALVGLMLSPEMAALASAGVEIPEITMSLLAAHLIIFWLSQDSNLTPPVCLAAFAAAAIAKTHPMKTGVQSWILGKGLYIVPLLFAFSPIITGTWIERFEVFGFAMVGILAFSIFIEGFWDRKLSILERVLFGISSLLMLSQDSMLGWESYFELIPDTHLVGLILFCCIMAYHKTIGAKYATTN